MKCGRPDGSPLQPIITIKSASTEPKLPPGLNQKRCFLSSITTTTPPKSLVTRYRSMNLRSKQLVLAYVLVAPVIIWRMFTTVYPFIATLLLSFQDNSPVRRKADFIGLANYQHL